MVLRDGAALENSTEETGNLDWVSGVRPTTDPAEEEFFDLPRP